MKRTAMFLFSLVSFSLLILAAPMQALAQEVSGPLTLTTLYPSQVVQLGESVTIGLKVGGSRAQTVDLSMSELPDGWSATFRGGGRIIQSVFVDGVATTTVDLRLDPPSDAAPGTYDFVVTARSDALEATLPLSLSVQERVPASLSLSSDLPTIKGSPSTTFRYNASLKNDGDQDLTINLSADAPTGFVANFKLNGQEVSSFPLTANETKSISIELDPLVDVPAGSYVSMVYADGGDLQASLELTAQVTGQPGLTIAGPDGRVSGRANAGRETTLQVVVNNTGSAPAQGVEMSATAPTGWTVTFDPDVIAEIPAGQQVEVTAHLKPADKAVAGDYMVTMSGRPADGAQESADFRITVTTSTLWGVAGIALIAIAVGVVALAVGRFGRR